MTRTMYDSTNVADDPLGADLVAYYIDGAYATTAVKVRQRFPSAVLVPISAVGSNAGIVGDQEPGCMSIEEAVAWVQQRRAAGFDPSIYVNEVYGWAGARQAFDAYGVAEPHWWVADYDGRPIIPGGAVAKQFENPPLTHGHFDRSVVADFWPGVDGAFGAAGSSATPHPQLHTSEDSNMAILFHPTITDRMDVLSIGSDGAVYHFFGTTDELTKGSAGSESWGGKFLPGTLSAAWYNDPANVRLVAQAVDPAGIAHIREVDTSGKVVRDWAPLMADATHQLVVGLPAVSVVPPPAVDDDSAYVTKAALRAAVESIA